MSTIIVAALPRQFPCSTSNPGSPKVQGRLLMPFGMLLPPQLQQQRRHLRKYGFGSMDLRMTARTERDHQVQNRLAGNAVMDSDRPLIATGSLADAASVLIPFQNLLSQTAEVFLILTLERIAGWTQAERNDTGPPAWTTQTALDGVLQFPTPSLSTSSRFHG